ncbi:hypothetical protein EJ06DRAFT_24081 [Trichodelitschia bisporula]|uniref:Uncharacterized protein n=1 Tax=Trichodelitschia bisporula TaxID=703511 RepID=A0A6G1IBA6_9PEZI|nr:hypothetical protein EJ06DRAFT_24081 [Trichodelitschia bisporula]
MKPFKTPGRNPHHNASAALCDQDSDEFLGLNALEEMDDGAENASATSTPITPTAITNPPRREYTSDLFYTPAQAKETLKCTSRAPRSPSPMSGKDKGHRISNILKSDVRFYLCLRPDRPGHTGRKLSSSDPDQRTQPSHLRAGLDLIMAYFFFSSFNSAELALAIYSYESSPIAHGMNTTGATP